MADLRVTDLARIAFEAYQEAAFDKPPAIEVKCEYRSSDGRIAMSRGARRRVFEDLSDLRRAAWIEAVEAVLRAARVDELKSALTESTYDPFTDQDDDEVISGPSPAAAGRGANPKKPKGEQTA